MCDDFPWAHIGGDIPIEELSAVVESGEHWGTVGGITSATYNWKPVHPAQLLFRDLWDHMSYIQPNEPHNKLAAALNRGKE